jgi:hypothetical protein
MVGSRRRVFYQTHAGSVIDKVRGVACAGLIEDVRTMRGRGFEGNSESRGDLLCALSAGDEAQNFTFPGCEIGHIQLANRYSSPLGLMSDVLKPLYENPCGHEIDGEAWLPFRSLGPETFRITPRPTTMQVWRLLPLAAAAVSLGWPQPAELKTRDAVLEKYQ